MDTSWLQFILPRAKLHLHLSYDFFYSHAVSKFCSELYKCTIRSLTCAALVYQLNSFHIQERLHSMQIAMFLFFSPDGSFKHVILFENMEDEVVTIGFV